MRTFLSFLFLALSFTIFGQNKKILLIGIDGCESSALQAANTPNIDELILESVYSLEAITEAPTWSGVGWSSMLTGVRRKKHGVSDNAFGGKNYDEFPHFIDRIETMLPEINTSSVAVWHPINNEIVQLADEEYNMSSDLEALAQANLLLEVESMDIVSVYFDEVDGVGHAYGFDQSVPEYIAEIEVKDSYVGSLMSSIKQRPNYDNEDWLVLISTDHGGNFSGHGGPSIEEREVFVIAHKKGLAQTELKSSVNTASINQSVYLTNTDQFIHTAKVDEYQFGESQDFTLSIQVKLSSDLSGDPAIISNKDWNSGLNPGFAISVTYPNGPQWKFNLGDGTNRIDLEGKAIVDNEWHELLVSCDRDGLASIYDDGALVRQDSMNFIGNINTDFGINFGQDGSGVYGIPLNGSIGDVKIWNRAFTEKEIKETYCQELNEDHPFYDQLIGYWKINDANNTSIVDHSSVGNNAIVLGNPIWTDAVEEVNCISYGSSPTIMDIAVTALDHMCVDIDPLWLLDGNSLLEACVASSSHQLHTRAFTIYPNPGFDQLFIDHPYSEKIEIKIFDLKGRLVFSQMLNTNSIDIDQLKSGVYSIQLSTTNGSVYQKFMKM